MFFLPMAKPTWALSSGDTYLEVLAGGQPKEQHFQSSLIGGYTFFEEFGLGLFGDFLFSGFQLGTEVRWFFEPFEVAAGVGTSYKKEQKTNSWLFTGSAGYLWALAPKIAFKVDFRGQFFIKQKSNLYLSGGLRFVF